MIFIWRSGQICISTRLLFVSHTLWRRRVGGKSQFTSMAGRKLNKFHEHTSGEPGRKWQLSAVTSKVQLTTNVSVCWSVWIFPHPHPFIYGFLEPPLGFLLLLLWVFSNNLITFSWSAACASNQTGATVPNILPNRFVMHSMQKKDSCAHPSDWFPYR